MAFVRSMIVLEKAQTVTFDWGFRPPTAELRSMVGLRVVLVGVLVRVVCPAWYIKMS